MLFLFRRFGLTLAAVFLAAYVVATLRSPDGLPALREKRRAIRVLQEQNANIAKENDALRVRNARLKHNPAEQEQQIRRLFKLQRRNETTFILPESGKPAQ